MCRQLFFFLAGPTPNYFKRLFGVEDLGTGVVITERGNPELIQQHYGIRFWLNELWLGEPKYRIIGPTKIELTIDPVGRNSI